MSNIKIGVAKGCILGPLIFLIYINDLQKWINPNANSIHFANDTSILIKNYRNTQEETANNTFSTIINWCYVNGLTMDYIKIHTVLFHTINFAFNPVTLKILMN